MDIPLLSSTDFTGFCEFFKYNGKLQIASMVAVDYESDNISPMPRDYHSLTDPYEKMPSPDSPENITAVYYASFVLLEFINFLEMK